MSKKPSGEDDNYGTDIPAQQGTVPGPTYRHPNEDVTAEPVDDPDDDTDESDTDTPRRGGGAR